ncbi:L-serine ammonia-lyase, iron-sulfur-dependent, subunit alpha [Halanaerobium hydrogeniformans]|uniref:L-serine dehydratase n=1 Tax=Halanaerobium hydrogeniformans TaxID=656519 RepID=E4RPR8_HALHG|nr:L-serine ammonia-lyase, iron-sulfur-dependent, subunit alpha [Halanaerobium hydrogeniformans]ADQ13952.1 L-serine dehydratase, iron-sulfur-dependent, alpha subunit [Halanaerobium hydrogeniformans]
MEYRTIEELLNLAEKENTSLAEIVLRVEMEESELSRAEIEKMMVDNLKVMQQSIKRGSNNKIKTGGGLVGDEALKMKKYYQNSPQGLGLYNKVITYALAVAEVNAGMGKIIAGPTAGASGIVPAVVVALAEESELDDHKVIQALFTASGLGYVISKKATLSGAAGGCQAECGAAAAMAAGAAVELKGGTPKMVVNAFALALKNMLGLVCDPVAGLVEVPCVKRNAFSAAHALTASSIALAGIESVIPADEVINAMTDIGEQMPGSLKETSKGGLAVCETALKIKDRLFNN